MKISFILPLELHDYGNFEKIGPLGTDFPRNDESITTEYGDVILYQGDQITIEKIAQFYRTYFSQP